jgi:hypothetical protein
MVACVSSNGEYRVPPPTVWVAEEGGRRDYRGGARGGRDPHGEANPDDAEVHPVDAELARRLPRTSLRKRVRAAQRKLIDALGARASLYLDVERLVGRAAREREIAAFNLGYERGRLEGRAEAAAGGSGRAAARLAQRAAESGEPLLLLLQAALAVARR